MNGAINPLVIQILLLSIEIFFNHSVVSEAYPVEEKPLYVPPMEEIAEALKGNLTTTFENVVVSIVDCPDLREKPFFLAGEGLNGSPTLFEGGSESYLIPVPDKTKVYDFEDIHEETGVNPAFVIGAGAGPFPYLKTASELIANLNVTDGKVRSLTQIGTVKEGKVYTETLPDTVSIYAFMSNFFISEGKPGKVIRVKVSKRIGEDNFPSTIRETLRNAFPEKSVGLGGTFLVTNSKVYQHVQPQFSEIPLLNDSMRDQWLVFYNMSPPLVAVGTLITQDPGLTLRPYHFHSLSDHNEAGHYHYDQDPETVEYLGYFNVAEKVVRVDRPKKSERE